MVIYQVLLNFFVSNPTLGKMECKHCHRCVSRRTYCMKRHLENCDADVFEEFNNMLGNQSTEGRKKTKVNKKMHSMSWGVDSFEMFLVEQMVEEGGLSSKFTNPCFQKYFGDVADTLEVSLEAPNVHKLVMDKYFARKQQVMNKVKDNFLFIKIDHHMQSSGDRYMAVHCQFYDEEIKQKSLYTLAVSKLHSESNKQTENFVKEVVLNTLEEFSIKKNQVLYVVTDQALINTGVEESENASIEHQDNIADELLSHFSNVTKEFGLKNRKCVAHELQAIINAAMQNSGCDELLAQLLTIKDTAAKSAEIKQRPEWQNYFNSKTSNTNCLRTKYDITLTLCEFKSVYLSLQREFPQLYISTQSWEDLEQVRTILSCCDIFSNTQLEEQYFTPSKFWFLWSQARHELEQAQEHLLISSRGFELHKEITERMREKETELLQNPMLLAAIYLDPQCRETLAAAVDIGEAKDAFAEVASYLFEKELKKKQPQEVNQAALVLASSFQSNGVELDDSDDEMLELLNERRRERRFGADLREVQNEVALFKSKLQQESLHKIMSFANSDSVSDILWEYATPAHKAAVTVTAIPITQSSMVRLFSAIEIMENPLNAHAKKYLLEAIVFLRTNGCSAPFIPIPQTFPPTLSFKSSSPLPAIPYLA